MKDEELYDELLAAAKKRGIELATPWASLPPETRTIRR